MSGAVWSSPNLFGARTIKSWSISGVGVCVGEKSTVEDLIRTHHYSKSVVWASNLHLLASFENRVIGALQFGPAMNPQSGSRIVRGSTAASWLELNRMVFTADRPDQSATRAIAGAIRLIRHLRPEVEWIQSFADERCGKFGAVYQAASFLYCGEHRATFYELDGEWFHKSALNRARVDKRGWGCGPKIERFNRDKHRATAISFRQFRYIKCLTKRSLRNLILPVLDYPKPIL